MQFYFAWVDATATTFGPEHHVFDERVYAFNLNHREGEFASLQITIRNPRIGLLAASRKQWAWLSVDPDGSGVVPMFFGRLIGVPTNAFAELVTLDFIAKPQGYDAIKAAFAETLKVFPYWDPIFISPDNRMDPDVVLEARPQLYCIDRVTHELTVSDLLDGEDGLLEFTQANVTYDSVELALEQSPARRCHVIANIAWSQARAGEIYLVGPGSARNGFQFERITTYTGDGLIENWPKVNDSFTGGWVVSVSQAIDVNNVAVNYPDEFVIDPAVHSQNDQLFMHLWGHPIMAEGDFWYKTWGGEYFTATYAVGMTVPLWTVDLQLGISYAANRKRFEVVDFTLEADVQPILTAPGEDEFIEIELSSVDVGEPIDGGAIPIGDVARAAYMPTDRGIQSLEYLIHMARAQLIMRSRAVKVTFDCEFIDALNLSLRKSALMHDPRMPGGQAAGKITEYTISLDGDEGYAKGTVVIGCAIGRGTYVIANPGEPEWVDTDYVADDYQYHIGGQNLIGAGDIAYSVPIHAPNDDGLVLTGAGPTAADVVTISVSPTAEQQKEAMIAALNPVQITTWELSAAGPQGGYVDIAGRNQTQIDVLHDTLKLNATTYTFTLHNMLGGPYTSLYEIELSELVIPAMIDLEAASS